MNTQIILDRPHHLLLARFFSRGLIAASIVTIVIGAALTNLERENYIRNATNSASERVARLVEHLGHQIENPNSVITHPTQLLAGATPLQQLVIQETTSSGLLRLDVVDSHRVIIGSSDSETLGQISTMPEVAEAFASGKVSRRVVGADSDSFLHFAAPITIKGITYVVLVDEPLTEMQLLIADTRLTVIVMLGLGFALTFAVLGYVVHRAGLEIELHQQEEARVKDLLGRYVSHQVAQKILAHGGLKAEGERRKISIVFADIRGFTALSEKLSPEKVVTLLNEYLATMTDIVFKYDGTVDKFLGDGLMAIFGAPLDHHDDVGRALTCAREMQSAFDQLRLKWQAQGLPDLGLGIGVNTGEAVVGSIGSHKRLDYTAIGDAVNTAQRLQSLAKAGQILIGGVDDVRVQGSQVESLGAKQVKGKSETVEVFELVLNEQKI